MQGTPVVQLGWAVLEPMRPTLANGSNVSELLGLPTRNWNPLFLICGEQKYSLQEKSHSSCLEKRSFSLGIWPLSYNMKVQVKTNLSK